MRVVVVTAEADRSNDLYVPFWLKLLCKLYELLERIMACRYHAGCGDLHGTLLKQCCGAGRHSSHACGSGVELPISVWRIFVIYGVR